MNSEMKLFSFFKSTYSKNTSSSQGSNRGAMSTSDLRSHLEQRDDRDTSNNAMTAIQNPSSFFKPIFGKNVQEHHLRLAKHAHRLWLERTMADLIIILEEKQYPCHKTVLTCYSKYFDELLLEEEEPVDVIILQSPSISNTAFEVLLTYMYTSELYITCQNIGEVYTAARKLRIDDVVLLCTDIFSGKTKHDVYSVYVYVTAKKEQLEDCAAKALKLMTRRFEHIVGTPEFLDLDFSQVKAYLTQDALATRSEVIVFLAAIKWLSVKYLEHEEYAIDIISCVRFPMMTLNEIIACFSPPLFPGVLELKEIKDKMMEATCYIAAATINEEKLFERYACRPRKYLLKRESTILWDPNACNPYRNEMIEKERAATKIQATFRGYRVRKNKAASNKVPVNKTMKSESSLLDAEEKDEVDSKTDDLDQDEMFAKQIAATIIQAAFRGFKIRKSSEGHTIASSTENNGQTKLNIKDNGKN